ncbi:hypothetical protein IH982_01550 [Patescibacteria group bacterium]|nr:hypothetical protein [Patescibacteria group bacterium]
MNIKNIRDVKNSLYRTGFPLEVAVLNKLASLDLMVHPGEIYFDTETQKAREVDLHALDFYPDHETVLKDPDQRRLIIHYVVECKKTEKYAWVFFKNAVYQKLHSHFLKFKSAPLTFSWDSSILKAFELLQGKSKLHLSFTEVPPRKDNTEKAGNIYSATQSVLKATEFLHERYASGNVLHLFIPVIVFHGSLYSANLRGYKSMNKLTITREKRILLLTNFPGEKKSSTPYALFIVHEDGLKNLLAEFRKLGEVIHLEWRKKSIPKRKAMVKRKK